MTFKRIDLDTIKEKFERAGIIPKRAWMDNCAMTAECGKCTNGSYFIEQGFEEFYVYGVMDGWDDDVASNKWQADQSDFRYKAGVEDGQAAALLMGL